MADSHLGSSEVVETRIDLAVRDATFLVLPGDLFGSKIPHWEMSGQRRIRIMMSDVPRCAADSDTVRNIRITVDLVGRSGSRHLAVKLHSDKYMHNWVLFTFADCGGLGGRASWAR